jgi:hypothetical protein
MIRPISGLCSAIAIPSNLAMLRLSLTADRKASITTAYGTEEPDETLASRPALMTNRSREGATYFHIQSLVEASAYAAFPHTRSFPPWQPLIDIVKWLHRASNQPYPEENNPAPGRSVGYAPPAGVPDRSAAWSHCTGRGERDSHNTRPAGDQRSQRSPRTLLGAMKHLGWSIVRCQWYAAGLSFMIQPRFEVLTEPFPEVPVQLRAVPDWVPKLLRNGPVRMP